LRELAARLRSTVRRVRGIEGTDRTIRVGDLTLDVERRVFKKGDQVIRLTPKEFDLLHYLMSHAGIPVPHARLLQAVWGPEYGGEVEYLRTFVRQLRKKFDDADEGPSYLLTEPYIGYRFRSDE
jgi:two-component system KDP operon response regulator KdpE